MDDLVPIHEISAVPTEYNLITSEKPPSNLFAETTLKPLFSGFSIVLIFFARSL